VPADCTFLCFGTQDCVIHRQNLLHTKTRILPIGVKL
jgi:hypothetical protein